MAIMSKDDTREVIVTKRLVIKDHEGDILLMVLHYDSTEEPLGAALFQVDVEESGIDGTWVTADDLREMARNLLSVAEAMDVAAKAAPKQRKFARR